MKTLTIPRTSLTVSAICCGTAECGTKVAGGDVDRLFDAFVEAGGTFFDTAHCYSFWVPGGDGASERTLGSYLARRGIRDRVVVATKGAHPNAPGYRRVERYMSAAVVARDLDESLERLGTGVVDLYWLHRDDPRVPVGEIVEFMNAQVARGRIRHFGGSNWTVERLAEANAWAASRGLAGFVASEPCWSLARRGPMDGGMHALEDRELAEYARLGVAVIPYSSTARGYFATGGASGGEYRNDASAARLARATELAARRGTTPSRIALAWLLAQPFPVVPIVGATKVEHLRDAIGAVDVALTAAEAAWLADGG